MERGETVGDRFVIEQLAGRGGMGAVFRASDNLTGRTVALKVLDGGPSLFEDRFVVEANALAAISHPAVVKYVAQGASGRSLYFAMEWLEGEDLAMYLGRHPRMDLGDALAMGARAADGIAAAHEAGLVHRDLKPSNLFLVQGDPRAVKVIDFGVARATERARPLTKTGQMIGTVGFMSPEQIAGERDLDHRADIFALGCVIYEAITGQPAFGGSTSIAIIAKVLREEPVRPSAIDPFVPKELDELILSMVAKPRAERPASAAEVAERLREIARTRVEEPTIIVPPAKGSYSSVSAREQSLVSVVLLVPREPSERATEVAMRIGESHGADTVELGEGAHLFVMGSAGSAKDQAARAASCALAIRADLPDAKIAIGTGLAEATGSIPVGPAIDRAAALVESCVDSSIPIDDVTAGLLGEPFEIQTCGRQPDRASFLRGRTVAQGRPTARSAPFVGRDKELAIIEAVLSESFGEGVPRSVVVTGAPGAGKSRLRREMIARALGREGDLGASPRAVVARADVVGAGSVLGLAKQAAEQLVGVREGDGARARATALTEYLQKRGTVADAQRTREFLGELIGCPSWDCPTGELTAARNEPRMLAEWLKRTFVELVEAEAKQAPLIIVLEDLHWGDDASVEFFAAALAEESDTPLLLLALARPEVWTALPRLRELFEPQEIVLHGLTARAAQRLAEAVLGARATPPLVASIVQRSDGNPFFLEELARGSAEGHGETSDTVLAVLNSRIQRLEPEARRLLRAASVFGRTFRKPGLLALLGDSATAADVTGLLEYLEQRDILVPDTRAEDAFSFKHDLLRDASYRTLPEADRKDAHRRAGEWLEGSGGEDAIVLAEHFECAGEADRAIEWLARGVAESLNAGSHGRVIALAERAVAAGAQGRVRGSIRSAESLSRAWQHDWPRARIASTDALALTPKGSVAWFRAVAIHSFACVSLGDPVGVGDLAATVLALETEPESSGPYGFALLVLIMVMSLSGHRPASEELLRRLNARVKESPGEGPPVDPGFVAWRAIARAHVALAIYGLPGDALRNLDVAERLVPSLADPVAKVMVSFFRATAYHDAGASARAGELARLLISGQGPGAGIDAVPYVRSWTHHVVGRSLLGEGKLEDAYELASSLPAGDDALFSQRARSLRAQTLIALGRDQEALSVADAIIGGTFAPQDVAIAWAARARAQFRRGDADQATTSVRRALDLLDEFGGSSQATSFIHLTHLRILIASGPRDEARTSAAAARARIATVADDLDDAELKRAWLSTNDNAKTLSLAETILPCER